MSNTGKNGETDTKQVPDYLKHWPGLKERKGDQLVDAPPEDVAVAKSYPDWPDKGPVHNGKRLTVMTAKTTYKEGEEVRVIHVVEVPEPGHEVYVMGPKEVYGEYVDGKLATKAPPPGQDPTEPDNYDGVTMPSPWVDYNYDITTYKFSEPGKHEIYWKIDSLKSNTLTLEVK